jgi:hypothetical protein
MSFPARDDAVSPLRQQIGKKFSCSFGIPPAIVILPRQCAA